MRGRSTRTHSDLLEYADGSTIRRVDDRNYALAPVGHGPSQTGAGGLRGVAAAPARARDMESEFDARAEEPNIESWRVVVRFTCEPRA
jgi:hypothetical protein